MQNSALTHPQLSIEICISADNINQMKANLIAAQSGGAHRIELCADMQNEGLTPAIKAIIMAKNLCSSLELLTMIRPRAGDFVYNDDEYQTMLTSIEEAQKAGADGVVFGALTQDGDIHLSYTKGLINKAKELNLKTTFHRAFDASRDPISAWQYLENIGINRILSSGTAWGTNKGAIEGAKQLVNYYSRQSSVELVIGGGVNPSNAQRIISPLLPLTAEASLHAFSGVMLGQKVDTQKVKELCALDLSRIC